MRVECTYKDGVDVSLFLSDTEAEGLTAEEAKALGEQLIAVAERAKAMRLSNQYKGIGQRAMDAANKYIAGCLDNYSDKGLDYDHGPAFEGWAEELVDKFSGLSQEQLVQLMVYMLESDGYMDLPVACLMSVLHSHEAYPEEVLIEVNKDPAIMKVTGGYEIGF